MMVTWVNIIWFYRQSYLLDVSVSSGIFQMMVTDGYGAKIFIASQKDDLANQRAMPCLTMSWNHAWKKRAHTAHTYFFRSSFLSVWKQEPSSCHHLLCEKMAPTKKQLSIMDIMGTQTSSSDISQVPRFHGLTSFCQPFGGYTLFADKPTTFLANIPQYSHNIPIISPYYIR